MIIRKGHDRQKCVCRPGAVIQADEPESFIRIGDNCNIQDRVVAHALANTSVIIGRNTSLSHGLHCPWSLRNPERVFIGFGSVIFKAKLENRVLVNLWPWFRGKHTFRRLIHDGAVVDTAVKGELLSAPPREIRKFSQKSGRTNYRNY